MDCWECESVIGVLRVWGSMGTLVRYGLLRVWECDRGVESVRLNGYIGKILIVESVRIR